MIQVGRVKATTYDQLFEAVKALDWQKFIPVDGKFWVKKAGTVKSKLFSPSDIQRIVKKAIVEKLKMEYHESWFAEDGAEYPIRVFFYKDEAIIALDTSDTAGTRVWWDVPTEGRDENNRIIPKNF